MTAFVLAAAGGMALVLVLLLRPFLWNPARAQTSHRDLNAAIYRDQFARLEHDLRLGTLGPEDLARARAELQRRVFDETKDEDAMTTYRSPRKTILAILLVLPLAAAGLYALIGSPASFGAGGKAQQHAGDLDLERMVAGLAAKKDPGNQKGWAMLAR